MAFPLQTADSFNAPWDLAEAEEAAAQHGHDAQRHAYPQDSRGRVAVLRGLLETADRYLLAGIWDDHQHARLVHDVQEELAVIEQRAA